MSNFEKESLQHFHTCIVCAFYLLVWFGLSAMCHDDAPTTRKGQIGHLRLFFLNSEGFSIL